MELVHEFTVPVGVSEAWAVLLDVERVAPCMPGAALTEVHGDEFAGTVKVKLGPVNLTYAGKARFVEKDDDAHRVVMEASGKESRGSGTARATVTATLTSSGGNADGDQSDARVVTDLRITGRPAQFGRGMLQDVGNRLVGQFADNLAAELRGDRAAPADAAAEPSEASTTTASFGQADVVGGPRPGGDQEAIDLLQITGASKVLTRYGPPALAVIVVLALLCLFRHRRRRHR